MTNNRYSSTPSSFIHDFLEIKDDLYFQCWAKCLISAVTSMTRNLERVVDCETGGRGGGLRSTNSAKAKSQPLHKTIKVDMGRTKLS